MKKLKVNIVLSNKINLYSVFSYIFRCSLYWVSLLGMKQNSKHPGISYFKLTRIDDIRVVFKNYSETTRHLNFCNFNWMIWRHYLQIRFLLKFCFIRIEKRISRQSCTVYAHWYTNCTFENDITKYIKYFVHEKHCWQNNHNHCSSLDFVSWITVFVKKLEVNNLFVTFFYLESRSAV